MYVSVQKRKISSFKATFLYLSVYQFIRMLNISMDSFLQLLKSRALTRPYENVLSFSNYWNVCADLDLYYFEMMCFFFHPLPWTSVGLLSLCSFSELLFRNPTILVSQRIPLNLRCGVKFSPHVFDEKGLYESNSSPLNVFFHRGWMFLWQRNH